MDGKSSLRQRILDFSISISRYILGCLLAAGVFAAGSYLQEKLFSPRRSNTPQVETSEPQETDRSDIIAEPRKIASVPGAPSSRVHSTDSSYPPIDQSPRRDLNNGFNGSGDGLSWPSHEAPDLNSARGLAGPSPSMISPLPPASQSPGSPDSGTSDQSNGNSGGGGSWNNWPMQTSSNTSVATSTSTTTTILVWDSGTWDSGVWN